MVQWRKRDGTTVRWQWCKYTITMVQWYDGDEAILYCTIVIASFLHHLLHQATEFFAHMRYLKKMATGLHCNLQLLWFIYHWSNIMHACIKCVYSISFFLMLIRSKECDKHWPILISIHFWFLECFQKPQFIFNVTQHYCLKYLNIFSFNLYVVYLCSLFPIFSK